MRKYLLISVLFFGFANAQPLKVSDIVSENKLTNFENQKLILVDFWATWCEPCVSASQQLEILQDKNLDKVFMISISDEHETKIAKYLKKIPINLMVVSDFDSYTFDKYKIQSRPTAILLNLSGDLLWKGHPSDMTQSKLNSYFNKESNRNSIKSLNSIMKVEKDQTDTIPIALDENFLEVKKSWKPETDFIITDSEVNYLGTISNLYLNLLNLTPNQVEIATGLDKKLKLRCSKKVWDTEKNKVIAEVLNLFSCQETKLQKTIEATEIIANNPKLLWDKSQMNWEDNPVNYLIGTDRIQADNMSLKEIAILLSKAKEQPYVYLGKNNELYDWDFNFLYDDLMAGELESSFGIELKPVQAKIEVIKIE